MISKTTIARRFFAGEDTYSLVMRIYEQMNGRPDELQNYVENAIREYIKSGKRWADFQKEIA